MRYLVLLSLVLAGFAADQAPLVMGPTGVPRNMQAGNVLVVPEASQVKGIAPLFDLYDTDATVNERRWRFDTAGDQLRIRAVSDDGLSGGNAVTFDRTTTTAGLITINPAVQITGGSLAGSGMSLHYDATGSHIQSYSSRPLILNELGNDVLVGITGSGGKVSILPTTASTSPTTGALTVAGGMGVAGDTYTGGNSYHAGGGVFRGNFTPSSGAGIEIVYASGAGFITAYDRDLAAWKPWTLRGSSIAMNISGTDRLTLSPLGVMTLSSTEASTGVASGNSINTAGGLWVSNVSTFKAAVSIGADSYISGAWIFKSSDGLQSRGIYADNAGVLQFTGTGVNYFAGPVTSAGVVRSDGSGARHSIITTGGASNFQLFHPATGAPRLFNSGGAGLALGLDDAGAVTGGGVNIYGQATIGTELGIGKLLYFKDVAATPTKHNWVIGAQNNIDNGFEITASTLVGGSVFSTPIISMTTTGISLNQPVVAASTFAGDYSVKVVNGSATGHGLRVQAGADGNTALAVRNTAGTATPFTVTGGGDTTTNTLTATGATVVNNTLLTSNTTTNTAVSTTVLTLNSTSSGVAATGFGGGVLMLAESSTTNSSNVAYDSWEWANATHASRLARRKFHVYDFNGQKEVMRFDTNGTAAYTTFSGLGVFPIATTAQDLGSSGLRWNNAFVQTLNVAGNSTFTSTVTVPTPSAGTDAANKAYVDLAVSGGVTPNGLATNLLINGGMDIWQRGTTFSGGFAADRWNVVENSEAVVSITRSTVVPTVAQAGALFSYSLLSTVTTADTAVAADNTYLIRQGLEGYTISKFAGQNMVLSFWVRSSKTGTYSVALNNGGADRNYVTTFTVNAVDTWEKKSVTFTMDTLTAGTWYTDNRLGLRVVITLMSGSNHTTATLGSWQGAGPFADLYASTTQVNWNDTVGATFYLTGVQLETGTAASNFQIVNPATLLEQCQRYYEKSYDLATNPATATQAGAFMTAARTTTELFQTTLQYKVRKRGTPSVGFYSPITGAGSAGSNLTTDRTLVSANGGEMSCQVRNSGGALVANESITYHYTAESEL